MDVKVRFRFNKVTGEVEVFEVDQESGLPNEEHNLTHDQLASEIGALLDRHPRIREVSGAAPAAERSTVREEPAAEEEVTPETRRRQKDV